MTEGQILTTIEYTAVALNILYILFAAKEKRVAWVFGGIASLISVYLFYKFELVSEAKLYAFYFIMAIYGFVNWSQKKEDFPIRELSWKIHLGIITGGVLLSFLFIWIAGYAQKADYIYLDAITTSFSILATFLTIKKILSNWIYWIIIDILSIYMYYIKGLDIYAIQMILFTILAVVAFIQWRKVYTFQSTTNEA